MRKPRRHPASGKSGTKKSPSAQCRGAGNGATPTRRALEQQVAALEHGYDALAVTSGLAAMDVVLRLFSPGDRIIVSGDLYGGSYRLFDQVYSKYGLIFDFVFLRN